MPVNAVQIWAESLRGLLVGACRVHVVQCVSCVCLAEGLVYTCVCVCVLGVSVYRGLAGRNADELLVLAIIVG